MLAMPAAARSPTRWILPMFFELRVSYAALNIARPSGPNSTGKRGATSVCTRDVASQDVRKRDTSTSAEQDAHFTKDAD